MSATRFDKLLRNACRNCKPTSLKTYAANIRALARLAKLESVPTHKRWLTAALLQHVKLAADKVQAVQHGGCQGPASLWCERR